MKDTTTPRIKLTGVTKSFGFGDAEIKALDEIDLTVKRGEFIAIMGPSGCGKTTLLNVVGLLDQSTDGEYNLDGKPVDNLNSRQRARTRSEEIGFVFQNFNLIPRLTVIENVALPLTYKGLNKTKRLQEASRVLKTFHLSEREYYMPHQLSGGQIQRVAIARALVNNPSIILADEPTGNLDSKTSHVIMEELADLHRRGNTIIMVTHNPELTSYASRVITMLDGKIDTDEHKQKTAPFKKKLIDDTPPSTHSSAEKRPLGPVTTGIKQATINHQDKPVDKKTEASEEKDKSSGEKVSKTTLNTSEKQAEKPKKADNKAGKDKATKTSSAKSEKTTNTKTTKTQKKTTKKKVTEKKDEA